MTSLLPESNRTPLDQSKITTLIFDIDDTLYDVGTGFTAHRNGEGATSFMVAKLNFPDMKSAQKVRDKYFARYHSTAKALAVAEKEGELPPSSNKFQTKDLSQWWAEKLNFSLLGGADESIVSMLESCPLNLVAFSNGPRLYVLRVLREIGLDKVFPPEKVFAVDDVLPSCKPEKEAFEKVLDAVGVKDASECIMVEDSMKNIRAAKELGMGTVLVAGLGRLKKSDVNKDAATQALADKAEATKPGDAPDVTDDAVDICIESVAELESSLPSLWNR
mmetsp:Transcript_23437/g.34855  ORF Transcript_23437/g.34855 Transcript_23437/m.34855 type:complete len:276 (+) Transcript_23437:55-882(+)